MFIILFCRYVLLVTGVLEKEPYTVHLTNMEKWKENRASTAVHPGWKVIILVVTDMEKYLVCFLCFGGNLLLIFLTGVEKNSKAQSKVGP